MKKVILLVSIISGLLFGGCSTNSAMSVQIHSKAVEQAAVFEEMKDDDSSRGDSILIIKATMKTVKEGFYPLESKNTLRGKPEYPFVFNIGGQGIVWQAKGLADKQIDRIDEIRNPEGGEGVKYILEKRISIKPGTYKIFLGLAEEKFLKEFEITLAGTGPSILEFRPVYGRDKGKGPMFYRGINDFEVFLDGHKVGPVN
ncbi:MAG: hypothetical protein C0402_12175 [Thermodesulfovibrio sp.]|nr:hypothetical protein [Thermodesulfovibrio sp.]